MAKAHVGDEEHRAMLEQQAFRIAWMDQARADNGSGACVLVENEAGNALHQVARQVGNGGGTPY